MEFIERVGATVVGGALLTFIFFLLRDFFFRIPNLNGRWIFDLTTEESSYKPYRGMKLTYLVLLWQEGNTLQGTGEKVQEVVGGERRTYTGKYRSHIEIRGYLTKRYLKRSEVTIHYKEHGEKRQSSTLHTLRCRRNSTLRGDFISTIANSRGKTVWTRDSAQFDFEGNGAD